MSTLYYIEVRAKSEQKAIEKLESLGLIADAIKAHCFDYGRSMTNELIMWCDGEKHPAFVHRSQEDIIKKCGTKIDY